MKNLIKRTNKNHMNIKAFVSCYCGCSCRPYEDSNKERYQSNAYDATMSQG